MQKYFVCACSFFVLKIRLQELKFEFCQIKLEAKLRLSLQLTGKTFAQVWSPTQVCF